MLTHPIPFEVHITLADLTNGQVDLFVVMCAQYEGKPLLIELSQGEYIKQPMFSKIIYANRLEDVLAQVADYPHLFTSNHFRVNRVKIEIPSSCADLVEAHTEKAFNAYFEWHGKTQFTSVEALLEVCAKHKAHLSRNALKDASSTRFVTLREFGSQETFQVRLDALVSDLEQGGWKILKQQSEYCLYDTNTLLDQGWLPR